MIPQMKQTQMINLSTIDTETAAYSCYKFPMAQQKMQPCLLPLPLCFFVRHSSSSMIDGRNPSYPDRNNRVPAASPPRLPRLLDRSSRLRRRGLPPSGSRSRWLCKKMTQTLCRTTDSSYPSKRKHQTKTQRRGPFFACCSCDVVVRMAPMCENQTATSRQRRRPPPLSDSAGVVASSKEGRSQSKQPSRKFVYQTRLIILTR